MSDEWHPASELPKLKDYEPTGTVQVWDTSGAAFEMAKEDFIGGAPTNITHWRRISDPNHESH